MAYSQTTFPLNGVIGIVDTSSSQLDLAKQFDLTCVEIRADLLRHAGLSDDELMSVVAEAKARGLAVLFTLRHEDQGGKFNNDEGERVALCSAAIDAGADIIDLEHGTDSASEMLERTVPLILSYHNFERMIDATELAALSVAMEQQSPAAVKIIPTGRSLTDALTMMRWVAGAGDAIRRIGFSMGEDGAVSRILALSQGAPITYASFGAPVAPGQVDIKVMLDRYRCMSMSQQSKVTAVIGDKASTDIYIEEKCNGLDDQLCVGFATSDAAVVEQHQRDMNISEIIYV